MAGALVSLNAWGRALADAVIVAGAVLVLAALAGTVMCVLFGRCSCWRRSRGERRYARAGIRDLERYLNGPLTGAAPPGRPGHGEPREHGDGGGDR